MKAHFDRPEPLRRDISLIGVATLALNGLIGAGIFALPAAAAQRAGMFSPWMFVLCGALMGTVVLSFAQAASYFRGTGGPVLYAQSAFGSFVGFQTGWLLYLGRVSAMAANTNALVAYGAGLWPGMDQGAPRVVAILAVCFLLTWVNVIGVRRGIGATNVLTVLKLLPLALFIVAGLLVIKPVSFLHASPPEPGEFAPTLLVLVYAFVGFEGALVPAGEVRQPRRDIPRALLTTLAGTTALYVLIQAVCVGVLPGVSESTAPLAGVASRLVGPVGAGVMTLAALLSISGNISTIMLTAPRMTYALARDAALPAWLGNVHSDFKTPHRSIVFLGLFSFALAVSGSFVWLAVMSSLARMLGYAVCIAALPRLGKKFADSKERFNLPGGLVIPGLALLICLWLAAQAGLRAWLVTACFVLLGAGLFFYSRVRAKSSEPRRRA